MDDTQELIKNIAVRIVEHDMTGDLLHCQRRQWGNYIQNPLPIDSVTASSPIFFTQLMKTVGNASHRFEEQLNAISSSAQDRGMLCAAAASGMGKTHIAYDVGKKHFLILIRVMGNSGEFNGDQLSHKSPPWDSALEHMKQFKARSLAEPLIQRAKGMLRYIHILLYTYLQFTISALNAVALDLERRKELVLRLHRNGVADELIKKLFVRNVHQLTNVDTHGICESKFCSFRQEVIDSSWDRIPVTEKLIFCVDEINGLAGDFFTDFGPRSTMENAENFEDGGEPECRGLMYGLFCVLKKISTTHPSWYCYVTGMRGPWPSSRAMSMVYRSHDVLYCLCQPIRFCQ